MTDHRMSDDRLTELETKPWKDENLLCLLVEFWEALKAERTDNETLRAKAKRQFYDEIVPLQAKLDAAAAKIKRVEALPQYAVTTTGFDGWDIVPAEGYEARTFIDFDELKAALQDQK